MSDEPQRQDEVRGPETGALDSLPGPAEAWNRRVAIGHPRAMLSALGVLLYFVAATVWLPSTLLRSSLLAGASRTVADAVALVVWLLGFGIGLWGLRKAQDRAWI